MYLVFFIPSSTVFLALLLLHHNPLLPPLLLSLLLLLLIRLLFSPLLLLLRLHLLLLFAVVSGIWSPFTQTIEDIRERWPLLSTRRELHDGFKLEKMKLKLSLHFMFFFFCCCFIVRPLFSHILSHSCCIRETFFMVLGFFTDPMQDERYTVHLSDYFPNYNLNALYLPTHQHNTYIY